jgi:hypothetical protein
VEVVIEDGVRIGLSVVSGYRVSVGIISGVAMGILVGFKEGVTVGVVVGSREGVGIVVGLGISRVKVQLYVDVKPALLLNWTHTVFKPSPLKRVHILVV